MVNLKSHFFQYLHFGQCNLVNATSATSEVLVKFWKIERTINYMYHSEKSSTSKLTTSYGFSSSNILYHKNNYLTLIFDRIQSSKNSVMSEALR